MWFVRKMVGIPIHFMEYYHKWVILYITYVSSFDDIYHNISIQKHLISKPSTDIIALHYIGIYI